ncbi:hypothetical protein Hanom_Chr14g01289561 [Helianthus anomalus]
MSPIPPSKLDTEFTNSSPSHVSTTLPGCQAEVAISGLVCHPNIKHPSFSSTLYPSPPANKAKSILACLNALDPRCTGLNPAEFIRVRH